MSHDNIYTSTIIHDASTCSELDKNQPLLVVDHLSVDFHNYQQSTPTRVVNDVSFSIFPGEILALVGESGSGKSMIARSLLKLLPYPSASHPTGHIWFQGKDLQKAPTEVLQKIRSKEISMVFQEPMSALNPLKTIGQQITEVILTHQKTSKNAAWEQAKTLLEQVKIDTPEKRLQAYPHELSGGQRQRVVIAIAIANQPKILIADEPTTALDVTVQAQIIELLIELQQKTNMSILLISHDLNLVKKFAQRVLVMKSGEIVETAPTEQLFRCPSHPYTQMLIASEPSGFPTPVPANANPILTIELLNIRFPIYKGIFRRIDRYFHAVQAASFQILTGESVGIVGESGSGKTSLAFAILRLLQSEGRILFHQQDLNQLNLRQVQPLRQKIQMVFQDPYGSLNPRFCIEDLLTEGLNVHFPKLSPEERTSKVQAVLEEVGLKGDMLYRYPHEFSGGQRQRIAIARAIILKAQLIVLDEPTSALDRSLQTQIIELLKSLQTKYQISYLFISHDLQVVQYMSDSILVMQKGHIVERIAAKELYNHAQHPYTQQLIAAQF